MELLRPTLLHWGNALYELPGFLHWGLNHYRPGQDPFAQSVVGHAGGNKPGSRGPWSSARFEAQREGAEDYELLMRLRERRPRRFRAILRRVIRSFRDYTTDVRAFRRARRDLPASLS